MSINLCMPNSNSDLPKITADADKILQGYTANDGDGNSMTGILPDLTRLKANGGSADTYLDPTHPNTTVTKSPDEALHMITNGDGIRRFCVQAPYGVFGGTVGKLSCDGYVGITPSILGNAPTDYVFKGATFTSENGINISGTMLNRGDSINAGGDCSLYLNSDHPTIGVSLTTAAYFTFNSDGFYRFCMQAVKGAYGVGASANLGYLGVDASIFGQAEPSDVRAGVTFTSKVGCTTGTLDISPQANIKYGTGTGSVTNNNQYIIGISNADLHNYPGDGTSDAGECYSVWISADHHSCGISAKSNMPFTYAYI